MRYKFLQIAQPLLASASELEPCIMSSNCENNQLKPINQAICMAVYAPGPEESSKSRYAIPLLTVERTRHEMLRSFCLLPPQELKKLSYTRVLHTQDRSRSTTVDKLLIARNLPLRGVVQHMYSTGPTLETCHRSCRLYTAPTRLHKIDHTDQGFHRLTQSICLGKPESVRLSVCFPLPNSAIK